MRVIYMHNAHNAKGQHLCVEGTPHPFSMSDYALTHSLNWLYTPIYCASSKLSYWVETSTQSHICSCLTPDIRIKQLHKLTYICRNQIGNLTRKQIFPPPSRLSSQHRAVLCTLSWRKTGRGSMRTGATHKIHVPNSLHTLSCLLHFISPCYPSLHPSPNPPSVIRRLCKWCHNITCCI